MFDDLSAGSWLVILCAFGLGFVLVRLVVVHTNQRVERKGGPQAPRSEHARDPQEAAPGNSQSCHAPAHWTEVLELAAHASVQDIHAAYRRKMAQYHPDKVASLGPELQALAEQTAKRINRAYDEALLERG